MTRKEIFDAALACVNGERNENYGTPEDSFQMIASFWNAYLCISDEGGIRARDVAAMLALLKIARIARGAVHDDNWVDLAGYAACGGEIDGRSVAGGA